MDILMDSNEAAELDATNVYVIEQPTIPQQIASVAVGTLVPLGIMAAGFGLFAAVGWASEKIADRRAAKKARKAAQEDTIVITDEK